MLTMHEIRRARGAKGSARPHRTKAAVFARDQEASQNRSQRFQKEEELARAKVDLEAALTAKSGYAEGKAKAESELQELREQYEEMEKRFCEAEKGRAVACNLLEKYKLALSESQDLSKEFAQQLEAERRRSQKNSPEAKSKRALAIHNRIRDLEATTQDAVRMINGIRQTLEDWKEGRSSRQITLREIDNYVAEWRADR